MHRTLTTALMTSTVLFCAQSVFAAGHEEAEVAAETTTEAMTSDAMTFEPVDDSVSAPVKSGFDKSKLGFGGGLSTFGITGEVSYEITPKIDVRGMFYYASAKESETVESDDNDDFDDDNSTDVDGSETYSVEADVTLGGLGVVADYYVIAGLRVSGGLFYSNSEINISGTGTATGTVTSNGISQPYDGDANLKGDVKFKNTIAPMIATGYRFGGKEGIYLATEVGAVFSSLEVSAAFTGASVNGENLEIDEQSKQDLQNEVDKANKDLSDVPVVPFVTMTVGYNF